MARAPSSHRRSARGRRSPNTRGPSAASTSTTVSRDKSGFGIRFAIIWLAAMVSLLVVVMVLQAVTPGLSNALWSLGVVVGSVSAAVVGLIVWVVLRLQRP